MNPHILPTLLLLLLLVLLSPISSSSLPERDDGVRYVVGSSSSSSNGGVGGGGGSAHVSWKKAPESEIKKHYFPYEQCLLNVADNLTDKNVSHKTQSIHNIGGCMHLIDNWFANLNKRCWLGSRQQRIDNGVCIYPRQFIYCRRMHQRQGFYNHWEGLVASQEAQSLQRYHSKTGGFALKLIDTILASGFDTLAFAGDSMAIQMSQRLACSLARRNLTMIEYGNFYSMSEGAVLELSEEKEPVTNALIRRKLALTMYRIKTQMGFINYTARLKYQTPEIIKEAKQYNSFPGIDKACPLDVNVSIGTVTECQQRFVADCIYKNTLEDLKRLMNSVKWGKTLHVVILPIIVKETWEWAPFAKALLEAENLFRESYEAKYSVDDENSSNKKGNKTSSLIGNFVVMSPFAQHFPGHPQGVFGSQVNRVDMRIRGLTAHENDKEAKSSPLLNESWAPCVRTNSANMQDDHPESKRFINAMDALDASWRSKIAFIDVNRLSNPWFDLHPESASTGWVNDCTHYGYNPMMYDAIWSDLEMLLQKSYLPSSRIGSVSYRKDYSHRFFLNFGQNLTRYPQIFW